MRTHSAGNVKPLVLIAIVAFVALGWYSMRTSGSWSNLPSNTQETQEGDNMSSQASASRVLHANDSTFEKLVLQADVPVLVDFYADWCGPCRMLAPLLEQAAAESDRAKVVKVNVDHSPGVASRYRVNAIPTLILFKGGEAVTQTEGLLNRQQLRSLLEM